MNAAAHLHLHLMMKYLDTGSLAQEHQSRGGRSGRHWRLSSLLGSLSSFSAFPHTFTVHFILMHANRSTFAFGSRTKPELRHITPQGCWVIESEQTFPRTHANPHYMGGYGDLWEQRASRRPYIVQTSPSDTYWFSSWRIGACVWDPVLWLISGRHDN